MLLFYYYFIYSFSTLQSQRNKRSKTQWHKPLTNAIFSSHFKETSRNEEFHIDQLVAKGAFGVVFKVIDKKSIKEQQQQPTPLKTTDNIKSPTTTAVYALKVLKKSKVFICIFIVYILNINFSFLFFYFM